MASQKFIQLLRNPVAFRLYLFWKLPAAFFSGVRIREIDGQHCVVTIPYKWFSQNPFRSTYFACLSMAAELSTGCLAMACIYKRVPPVSMLVVKVESEYFKKATGLSFFTCKEGKRFNEVVEECIRTGEPGTVRARSEGTNKEGEVVAEFF